MSDIFDITQCNLAQLVAESSRFLFQVFLIHITTCIVEGRREVFTDTLFKTLLITAMAIVMYHIFFRKIVEPKLEKMKTICSRDMYERRDKILAIHQEDPFRPKYRRRIDKKIRENVATRTTARRTTARRTTATYHDDANSKRFEKSNGSKKSKRSEKTKNKRGIQSPKEYAEENKTRKMYIFRER